MAAGSQKTAVTGGIVLGAALVLAGVTALVVWQYQTAEPSANDEASDSSQVKETEAGGETNGAQQYIGLTEAAALSRAKDNDKPARVVERDGESLAVTMDLRPGRLNFTVEDGHVIGVSEESAATRGQQQPE